MDTAGGFDFLLVTGDFNMWNIVKNKISHVEICKIEKTIYCSFKKKIVKLLILKIT